MNYTDDLFDYTYNKFKQAYPLSKFYRYYPGDDALVLSWDDNILQIIREVNGTLTLMFYNENDGRYDIDLYNINPYYGYDAVDYIYNKIDWKVNRTRPLKLY